MTTRSNLHTHCTYCDGANTIEEMALSAIGLGFESLGFSSHAVGVPTDLSCIKEDQVDSYFAEVDRVRNKYKDQILIHRGLEMELAYSKPDPRCEYVIGSVHFLDTPQGVKGIDYSIEMLEEAIKEVGDPQKYAKLYYDTLIERSGSLDYQIQGHFDLLTKFEEIRPHFVIDHKYKGYALEALDFLCEKGVIFEVNTGAISRGYRTQAYPADFILKAILERKAPIILSSDAHSSMAIACDFDKTEQRLKALGFKTQMKLTPKGFVEVSL